MFLEYLKPQRIVKKVKSKQNGTITVWKSWGLGTYIEVGGLTQSGWILKKIWGDTLRKFKKSYALCTVRSVLVLGLGGGSVVSPIKKYWPQAKITGVDIDPLMIKLGQEFLNLDKDVQVNLQDAQLYLSQSKQYFDLIVVDLYIGAEFPQRFLSLKFLKLLPQHGKTVIINRVWSKKKNLKEANEFQKKLKTIFTGVELFYPVANVVFICKK